MLPRFVFSARLSSNHQGTLVDLANLVVRCFSLSFTRTHTHTHTHTLSSLPLSISLSLSSLLSLSLSLSLSLCLSLFLFRAAACTACRAHVLEHQSAGNFLQHAEFPLENAVTLNGVLARGNTIFPCLRYFRFSIKPTPAGTINHTNGTKRNTTGNRIGTLSISITRVRCLERATNASLQPSSNPKSTLVCTRINRSDLTFE